MLRIRIGRRWTRERGTAPHDSVSLELDGVALVDGAEDEPLLPLVEALLACTGALARGTAMADVSLSESGLVLCLENTEDGCALRIVGGSVTSLVPWGFLVRPCSVMSVIAARPFRFVVLRPR